MGQWDYLAIDLLGSSLDTLYRRSGKETMDLRSVCCIAMQLVRKFPLLKNNFGADLR
jgi:casein kinase 1